ncbi:MAG: WD40 repeat protein [Verrucomicrobiales bacterium]|jgi:WD40 repeat protein
MSKFLRSPQLLATLTSLGLATTAGADPAVSDAAAPVDGSIAVAAISAIEHPEPVDFAKEIFPMLKANCIACHNASKAKGKLNLESPQAILKGGSEGPAVIPENGADSLLMILAAHQDDPIMPPDGNKSNAVPLTSDELGLLKLWIDQGAKGEAAAFVEAPEIWFPVKGAKQPIYNLAMAPDGRSAVAGRGNQIHRYDLARGVLDSLLEDPALVAEKNFESAHAAHRDLVQSLTIGPDGKVASGGFREVKIWSKPSQSLRNNIAALPEVVTALNSNAAGKRVITGDAAGNVRTWVLDNPEEKREAKIHDGAVTGALFSQAGDFIVTASADATIRVRPAEGDAEEVKVTTPAAIEAMVLAKEGTLLVTAHSDHLVRTWPFTDGATITPAVELAGHTGAVHCLANHGSLLATGAEDNSVRLWNLDEGKELRKLEHGSPVRAIAISPDGKQLVTAGGPVLKLWNVEDGAMLAEIKGDERSHAGVIDAELISNIAKTASEERKKRLDEAAKRLKEEGDKSKAAAAALAVAQSDLMRKRVARAAADVDSQATQITGNDEDKKKAKTAFDNADGEVAKAEDAVTSARQNAELGVRLTSRAAEESIQTESDFAAAEGAVKEAAATLEAAKKAATEAEKAWNSVAFSADGTAIIAGGDGQQINTWALNGTPLTQIVGHRAAVDRLLVAGDSILSAGANKTILHWDAAPDWGVERAIGDGRDHKQFADRVTAVAFDPSGQFLATGGGSPSRSGELKLWKVADGALVFENTEAHSDTIVGIEFSPDGRHIACASTDRFVRIFDAKEGNEIAAFEGHTSHVLDVAWRADGLVLASAGGDQVIKLWDFDGRKQIKTEQGFGKEVTSVDFLGATGSFLASSGDATVRINQEKLGGPDAYTHRSKSDAHGRLIVAGDQSSTLRVWNVSDKKLRWTFEAPGKESE